MVMGNCGVGIAPCKPEVRDIAAWDLVNVEGIPFEVLAQGITWDWVSFPGVHGCRPATGAGHQPRLSCTTNAVSPLRHGRRVLMDRAATPGETAQIQALLREAMVAGAVGWTTTTILQRVGTKGAP